MTCPTTPQTRKVMSETNLLRPYGSRSFHTNFEFGIEAGVCFIRPLREKGVQWNSLTDNGKSLLRGLFSIPGITDIRLNSYEMTIDKGILFSWDDIETEIQKVFMNVYGPDIAFEYKAGPLRAL